VSSKLDGEHNVGYEMELVASGNAGASSRQPRPVCASQLQLHWLADGSYSPPPIIITCNNKKPAPTRTKAGRPQVGPVRCRPPCRGHWMVDFYTRDICRVACGMWHVACGACGLQSRLETPSGGDFRFGEPQSAPWWLLRLRNGQGGRRQQIYCYLVL
jgi:hypothetical protein